MFLGSNTSFLKFSISAVVFIFSRFLLFECYENKYGSETGLELKIKRFVDEKMTKLKGQWAELCALHTRSTKT